MNKKELFIVRLVLITSVLLQVSPVPVSATQAERQLSFQPPGPDIFLPIITNNVAPPLPVGMTLVQGVTDAGGEIAFADTNANVEVTVEVKDAGTNPVSGMEVYFVSNGNQGRVLVVDPNTGSDSGYYYPAWAEVSYPSASSASHLSPDVPILIAIPIILIGGGLGFYHGYKLGENPPRIDLELGYTTVCYTYEQFKHIAAIGGIVIAVYTAGGSAAWHIATHFGTEVAVEEVVLEIGGFITEWGEDEAGWPGEWCFRRSWFHDGWWYVPETDFIKPSLFRTELRWDKNDTDVDLHIYDSFGNHAYFWDKDGIPGGLLDVDDTNGFGPEVYTQFADEGSTYYEIWVRYYSDHDNGATTATLEIYDDQDRLIGDYSKLIYDGDRWLVATLTPSSGQISVATANRISTLEAEDPGGEKK